MYTYLKIFRLLQEGIDNAKKTRNMTIKEDLNMRKEEMMVIINPFLQYVARECGAHYVEFINSYYLKGFSLEKTECKLGQSCNAQSMRRQVERYCKYYDQKI